MPLKFNDKLIAIDLPTYNVTVLPSSNGSVTATPSSGVPGTIVSLSNTPDQGYVLEGYQLTGSSLIDSDKFMIKKSDVSVQPSFWVNIDLSPSLWTIVNSNTISISGDTITQLGVGGWHEAAYIPFTVPETGNYFVSYSYDLVNPVCGNHAPYGFGLWFTPNLPNVDDAAQGDFYIDSANRTGDVILAKNETATNKKGEVRYSITCTSGVTYYIWYPGGALNDGSTYTLRFKNIRVTSK